MPRIRCHYIDCIFLEESYCSKGAVEFDPDEGCLTYSSGSALAGDDVWNDDKDDLDDWEDDFDEEDIWLDDDDEEF